MPRRRSSKKAQRDIYVCPRCGTRVEEPVKTWTLVSPFPDKKGRITVTVMGSFVCPNCGYTWRGVIKKIKTEAAPPQPQAEEGDKEEGEIIEIDLDEIYREARGG